jgi:hypothetical protein
MPAPLAGRGVGRTRRGARAFRKPDEFSRAHARTRSTKVSTSCISIATPLCAARLPDGTSCRSVPAVGDLCEHHARLAAELGRETVVNGAHTKKRSARQRTPVATESEPLELTSHGSTRPSACAPRSRSLLPRKSRRSVASCLRLHRIRRGNHGRHACARTVARLSVRRSLRRITALASRPWRLCSARDSGGSARQRSPSRGCRPQRRRSTPSAGMTEVHLRYLARAGDPRVRRSRRSRSALGTRVVGAGGSRDDGTSTRRTRLEVAQI